MCIQYLIAVCFVLCALADNAMSQTAPRPGVPKAKPDETWSMPDRNRVNEGTVTVITAPAGAVILDALVTSPTVRPAAVIAADAAD